MNARIIAITVAVALLSCVGTTLYYRAQLAQAHAETATARAQHARDLKAVSDTALTAEREASASSQAAAQKIEALDGQLTKERQTHEADSRNYRTALAAGTERLRVAVANCSAGRGDVSDAASAAGVGDGATAYADLDAATTQRVFSVAADDQREIDKLRALQGYVCAVRPETIGCAPMPVQSGR
ncbi:lysis system i-spanin subunit Rz [Ralstonia syzygii]|uniref:lysis system i-spanin subunit Rz n=1 Tax=Ralstonia syzygii TaxID=28097 RepID=UPI0018D13B82|nr:lysis system i-spanin subunit Rz [Ralstonia syzygii]